MTTKINPGNIQNLQTLEVEVSGPEGANRLFMIGGIAPMSLTAASNSSYVIQKETFSILLGPTLTRKQFFRATIIAFLTNTSHGPGAGAQWIVTSADADWDDESKQVEVRVDIQASVTSANNAYAYANVNGFGFQVNILAKVKDD